MKLFLINGKEIGWDDQSRTHPITILRINIPC